MIHGGVAGQRGFIFIAMPHGVAVPRDEVQRRRQLPVVVIVEILHKVGCHWQLSIRRFQRRNFVAAEIRHLSGIEAMPVKVQTMNGDFPLRSRGFDLRPVAIGVAPEGAPPGVIKIIQRFIARFQPVAETLLAQATVALAAILIGDMPAQHRRMLRVALRQQGVNFQGFLTIDRRRHTVVVAPTVQRRHAIATDAQDLRVLLRHPRRARAAWGREKDMNSGGIQFIQDTVQPAKLKYAFLRFKFRPAKYSYRHDITFCLLHHGNIFIDNIGIVLPLLRVIVGAMQ